MTPGELTAFAAIGFLAGGVGGLLGIGGSTVFIPVATLLFGPDQQVYQAAAMILNAAVAGSATFKHHRVGAVPWRLITPMAIAAIVMVLFGVAIGNALGGSMLARLFGVLLLVLAASELRALIRARIRSNRRGGPDQAASPRVELDDRARRHPALLATIGGAMGLLGGLLGVGGGTIGVPLLRYAARFPLRACIASAAAVTLPLAVVGAIYKNISLAGLPGESAAAERHALLVAAAVVPTAIAGAFVGATLVHRLPIGAIRVAFIVLLLVGGARMLATPSGAVVTPSPGGSSVDVHEPGSAGPQPDDASVVEASGLGPAQDSPSGTTMP